LGNAYSVSGIGIDKATQIAYHTLTTFLTSGSTYTDARYGSLMAAHELYGECSNEVIQTSQAWFAVGVGADILTPNLCGTFGSGTTKVVFSITSVHSGTSYCGSPVSINSGANITCFSEGEITILPGFLAENGSDFRAEIVPGLCLSFTPSFWRTGSTLVGAGADNPSQNNTNNLSGTELTLYPNPTDGTFKAIAPFDGEIQILNSLGSEVHKESIFKDQDINFDLSGKAKGIYFIKFGNGSETQMSKLVLQ
jgi:hypothetical protein